MTVRARLCGDSFSAIIGDYGVESCIFAIMTKFYDIIVRVFVLMLEILIEIFRKTLHLNRYLKGKTKGLNSP